RGCAARGHRQGPRGARPGTGGVDNAVVMPLAGVLARGAETSLSYGGTRLVILRWAPLRPACCLLHLAVLWSTGMFCQARTIRIVKTVVLLSLLGGLVGCSTWFTGDFKDPEVQLTK